MNQIRSSRVPLLSDNDPYQMGIKNPMMIYMIYVY